MISYSDRVVTITGANQPAASHSLISNFDFFCLENSNLFLQLHVRNYLVHERIQKVFSEVVQFWVFFFSFLVD